MQGYGAGGEMMKRLNTLLCRISPRYKFRQICKVIGIKPYPWQREFALDGYLGDCFITPFPSGRRTGKTMAVMLRLLMYYPHEQFNLQCILVSDPDWRPLDRHRLGWYSREYIRLSHACFDRGIPVILLRRSCSLNDLGRRP